MDIILLQRGPLVVAEADVKGRGRVLQMLPPGCADDRRRHFGLLQQRGQGNLRPRQATLRGNRTKTLGDPPVRLLEACACNGKARLI